MERNDLLVGFTLLIAVMLFSLGGYFLFSVVINLMVLSTYFLLYNDFVNYRSHSQYLLKRELKSNYGFLLVGILLLGLGRIFNTYERVLYTFNDQLPIYHLLEEWIFLIIFGILLIRLLLKDILELSINPSFYYKNNALDKPDKNEDSKMDKDIQVVREKKDNFNEESKDDVKKLPVIVITTE